MPLARATEGSAGYDLCLSEPLLLAPRQIVLAGTGAHVEIPAGYVGLVSLRSGFSRNGIIMLNAPGIIDADYRGEIRLALYNLQEQPCSLPAGMRVAQLVIIPCRTESVEVVPLDQLSATVRGSGGFGSTGQ